MREAGWREPICTGFTFAPRGQGGKGRCVLDRVAGTESVVSEWGVCRETRFSPKHDHWPIRAGAGTERRKGRARFPVWVLKDAEAVHNIGRVVSQMTYVEAKDNLISLGRVEAQRLRNMWKGSIKKRQAFVRREQRNFASKPSVDSKEQLDAAVV